MKKTICYFGMLLLVLSVQADDFSDRVQSLLPRMNIPELASVEPDQAAGRLLQVYKSRTSVTPPVSTGWSADMLSDKDLKYANDALKHIFVGQPAYDSCFCGDEIDWISSPVPDKEWVWQLNRMYFWNSMGKVYAQTRDEKYAEEWTKQMVHWVKNNPRNKEHAYAWRSIEAGKRGQSWSEVCFRFVQSPHFDEEALVYFLSGLYDHASFLMKKYRADSNWALMEADGLELAEEEGWVSFIYTQKEQRPAFRYRLRKTSANQSVRFITVVAPYENEAPDIQVMLCGQPPVGSNEIRLELSEKGETRIIGFQL